ncbi:MAG: hypothetical protein AABW80_03525 [Nanoarchaeota archaeon]
MGDICHFRIEKADAEVTSKGLLVRVYYPANPVYSDKRLGESLEFGVSTFTNLIGNGCSELASKEFPLNSIGGGALYLFNDGKIVCHRRDRHAPTHPLLHGVCSGFPDKAGKVASAEELYAVGLRESVEECLFITRSSPQKILAPRDGLELAKKTAKNLGLELELVACDFQTLRGQDTLEVYDDSGRNLFTANGLIDFLYETQTAMNLSCVRLLPFSSREAVPLDAEGMKKDGKFIHFNRESYIIPLSDLNGRMFGDVLDNPEVYQANISRGKPNFHTPLYSPPYLGPDCVKVNHPHVWAPDNLLTRALDYLGVKGYAGKWKEIELWKEKSRLERRSLIPKRLVNQSG